MISLEWVIKLRSNWSQKNKFRDAKALVIFFCRNKRIERRIFVWDELNQQKHNLEHLFTNYFIKVDFDNLKKLEHNYGSEKVPFEREKITP